MAECVLMCIEGNITIFAEECHIDGKAHPENIWQ